MLIFTTATRLSGNTNIIKRMILAGSDGLRFNFSYGKSDEKVKSIKQAMEAANELSAKTKILIDLPNTKTRLGGFPTQKFYVKENQTLHIKTGEYTDDPVSFIPIQQDNIGDIFYPEQTIIIDEGEVAIKVVDIVSKNEIICVALNSGTIYSFKGLNWNKEKYDKPKNRELEKERKISPDTISGLAEINPDYIACPSVNDEDDAKYYKKLTDSINWKRKPSLIFKIETTDGINNLEKIIQYCDIITLERGSLGINSDYEKMGIYQNYIIDFCKKKNKKIFISTQILESTISNFIPQRSEISDLTNMIIKEVDGIILCHETGVNTRPTYPISVAKKIIMEAEKYKKSNKI